MSKGISSIKPFFDGAFTGDLIDHREGRKHGGLGNWEYSQPDPLMENDPVRGAQLWGEFLRDHPEYYILQAELQLAERAHSKLPEFIHEPVTLHFMGIGTPEIFAKKDLMVTQGFNEVISVSTYDSNADYIYAAKPEVAIARPNVRDTTFSNIDFFEQNLRLYDPRRMHNSGASRVATMFGGTLLNLEGATWDGPPEEQTIARLNSIHTALRPGGYFIVTQDANDDPAKIEKAYKNQKKFACNLGHLINRDTPYHVDTSKTDFRVQYYARSKVLAHYLKLHFQGAPQSQEIHFNNSYKIPTGQFLKWAEKANFSSVYRENVDGVNLHVLEAEEPKKSTPAVDLPRNTLTHS